MQAQNRGPDHVVHRSSPPTATGQADAGFPSLLDAQRSARDGSIDEVLKRIVAIARSSCGARYSALALLGADGTFDRSAHTGADDASAAELDDLAERCLLGSVLDDPRPVRIAQSDIGDGSTGTAPSGLPATTFLGVPIRSGEEVLGGLYVVDRAEGVFTEDDEALVVALAVIAGAALVNARLYERLRRRQDWLSAAASVNRELLALDEGQGGVLQSIADTVLRLADADLVSIVRPAGDDDLQVEVSAGVGDRPLIGHRYPAPDSLAHRVMARGRGMVVERISQDAEVAMPWALRAQALSVGTVMVFPLMWEHGPRGAIVVCRERGRPPFDGESLLMAETFASQAAVAMELAAARLVRERLHVLDDRDRIARDLHDHVIQRIFASGLTLQGLAAADADEAHAERLVGVVDDLDSIIRQIRSTIFELSGPTGLSSLRQDVLDAAAEAGAALPTSPQVSFTGPVDTAAGHLLGDITAVVREAVSNVVRHASATRVRVLVQVSADGVVVDVSDDGVGWTPTMRKSGLRNLTTRAARLGGSLVQDASPDGGARLRWSVPL